MYKIGMFSKHGKVTVKTLRHYDEAGLLKPAYIDEETGYRYYTTDQLSQLHEIIALRQMGFSIPEIRSIIDNINIDKKYVDLLMKKIEKLNLESCINFMTNDVRIKIIERFKQFLNNIILLYVSFTGVLFKYHSIPANVRIGRAPPKLL